MGVKITIEDMHLIAKKYNGKCLSQTYIDGNSPLHWVCENGHEFHKKPNMLYKRFCVECIYKKEKLKKLDECKKIAENKDGYCLSDKYNNIAEKLEWKCKIGHIWIATFANVKKGTWCPICSSGIEERIIRQFFEQLLGESFIKIKPEWLKNTNGYKLELDGYCEKLNIAFEYNGEQHYSNKVKNKFKTISLEERKKLDKIKIDTCKKYNIILIIIPQLNSRIQINEIKQFIKNQLSNNNIKIPENFDNTIVDINKAYSPTSEKYISDLIEVIKKHNGELLSGTYLNNTSKFELKCKKNHKFTLTAMSIKAGTWCRICRNNPILTIEDMHKLAQSHNGLCLSTKYKNMNCKIKWKCLKHNHEWEATPANIYNGSWCPLCWKENKIHKFTIDYVINYLSSIGYTLLSDSYKNHRSKLSIKCNKCNTIFSKSFRNFNYKKKKCSVCRE
ncbi:MAG: zinc-ribbon domain-containing protein [Bacteroidales bacterium]